MKEPRPVWIGAWETYFSIPSDAIISLAERMDRCISLSKTISIDISYINTTLHLKVFLKNVIFKERKVSWCKKYWFTLITHFEKYFRVHWFWPKFNALLIFFKVRIFFQGAL